MAELVTLEAVGLDEVVASLNALGDPERAREGLSAVGALIESQTRRRLDAHGPSPDGAPWAPWSPAYAAGRGGAGGLLERDGHLIGSLGWEQSGDEVRVGVGVVYGAIHQFGGTIRAKGGGKLRIPAGPDSAVFVDSVTLPARPYLGVSDENAREIEDEIGAWITDVLQ